MLVMTRAGLRIFLQAAQAAWGQLSLWLYVNDVALTEATVLADLVLATFPGFVPRALNLWTRPYQVMGQTEVESDAQPIVFTQTYVPSPVQTVYGYAVLSSYPHLMWAEVAPAPIAMLSADQTVTVRPSLLMANQT